MSLSSNFAAIQHVTFDKNIRKGFIDQNFDAFLLDALTKLKLREIIDKSIFVVA